MTMGALKFRYSPECVTPDRLLANEAHAGLLRSLAKLRDLYGSDEVDAGR